MQGKLKKYMYKIIKQLDILYWAHNFLLIKSTHNSSFELSKI